MSQRTIRLSLLLVIGFLLGAGFMMVGGEPAVAPTTDDSTPAGTTPDLAAGGTSEIRNSDLPLPPEVPKNFRAGIRADDQPAGMTVRVSGFSLDATKWLAVYESSPTGAPGAILGALRVHPGDSEGTIDLLRASVPGGIYYVAILEDDGDNEFNRQRDLPPLSPEKVQIVQFRAL